MPNKYTPIIEKLNGYFSDLKDRPIVDEAFLDKIESQLSYPLPKDYREFVRDYNGIYFEEVEYPMENSVEGWKQTGNLDWFSPMSENGRYGYIEPSGTEDEDKEYYPGVRRLLRGMDAPPYLSTEIPRELFPIAYDAGGNLICLALFGLRPGAILWWSANPGGDENLYLIADSFDEFMHLLYVPN